MSVLTLQRVIKKLGDKPVSDIESELQEQYAKLTKPGNKKKRKYVKPIVYGKPAIENETVGGMHQNVEEPKNND